MSYLSQLKINQLNINNSDELKEIETHQTKSIVGGITYLHEFIDKKYVVSFKEELSDRTKTALDMKKVSIQVTQSINGDTNHENLVQRANITYNIQ